MDSDLTMIRHLARKDSQISLIVKPPIDFQVYRVLKSSSLTVISYHRVRMVEIIDTLIFYT